jgi:hypothetical protein
VVWPRSPRSIATTYRWNMTDHRRQQRVQLDFDQIEPTASQTGRQPGRQLKAAYSSSSPATSPVAGFTRWTLAHT